MKIVSITSQGQLTIPKKMLKELGITTGSKAEIAKRGKTLVVKPMRSFWDLEGSMYNGVSLTEQEFAKAREAFETEWPRKM